MREMFFSARPLEKPNGPALLVGLSSTLYDLPFLSETAKRNILGGDAATLLRLS